MKGFEKEDWDIRALNKGFKTVTHKKFKFIKFDFCRRGRGYPDTVAWEIRACKWTNRYNTIEYTKSVKRLTVNIMPEIFEYFMKIDDYKSIVMEYLFQGKY